MYENICTAQTCFKDATRWHYECLELRRNVIPRARVCIETPRENSKGLVPLLTTVGNKKRRTYHFENESIASKDFSVKLEHNFNGQGYVYLLNRCWVIAWASQNQWVYPRTKGSMVCICPAYLDNCAVADCGENTRDERITAISL